MLGSSPGCLLWRHHSVAWVSSDQCVRLVLLALLVWPSCSTLQAPEYVAPDCAADAAHSGNSLLQLSSPRSSRVSFPVEDAADQDQASNSRASAAPIPLASKTASNPETPPVQSSSLLQEQVVMSRIVPFGGAAVPQHQERTIPTASIDMLSVPSPPPVLLEVGSMSGHATEVAAADSKNPAVAALLVRSLGAQVHSRLLAAAATSSAYGLVTLAALMCIAVLTYYLFMQSPGGLPGRDSKNGDGTFWDRPQTTAARPKSMGGPRQSSRQLLYHGHTPPRSTGYPSGAAADLLPSNSPRLQHVPAPLAMPYSAGPSPVVSSKSLAPGATQVRSPPPSQRSLPPGPGGMPKTTKGLCPGLIVPDNSECVLAICSLSDLQGPKSPMVSNTSPRPGSLLSQMARSLDILDLQGKPVMRAHVVLPWPQDAAFKQRPAVVTLCTMNPSTTMPEERLTFCRAGGEGGGRRSMYIYDKEDVLFGCIKRDVTRPRYVLTSSRGGLQLLFEGDFRHNNVNVLSDSREMLSHTEPSSMRGATGSSFYQVRIIAGIDVGLIVSGLLSIEAMETM